MQCYTELVPPTAVTHAVSLPFLAPDANNLVVAKTSLLQVFEVRGCRPTASSNGTSNGATSAGPKFSLIGEYPLSGTITSLASVKTLNTKTGGEALLIASKDAKLSLVEWDPENHRISTISIHLYEGDNIISQPFGPSLRDCDSFLTVDPSSRCAALKFGAKQLAILPFRQLGDELAEEVEDGYDADMADAPPSAGLKRTATNHDMEPEARLTPYKSSFVLPLTTLDPALTHPVHLAFLHEYREPTFGILSAPLQPSPALAEERKDCLTYTVFTLDLEQRASTNLISVPKLPSDLWNVVPLALPVGGALLVGTNSLVHVDQSGRTSAVAVNEFAKQASNFSMSDQSGLRMKLEGCGVEMLDPRTGDLLLVLNDGSLAVLSFKLLGRNIGGLTVARIAAEQGGLVNASAPSCLAALADNMVFVGSEDGDSALLGWVKDTPSLNRKRSHAQMLGQDAAAEDAEDAEDVDEDDLYAPSAETVKRTASSSSQSAADAASSYHFALHDALRSLGPINNVCLGKATHANAGELELLAGVGRGEASRLAFMTRAILPTAGRTSQFEGAKKLWSASVQPKQEADGGDGGYDNLLFVYDGEQTKVYDINDPTVSADEKDGLRKSTANGYVERSGTEFEHDGETVAIGTLGNGTRLVQCRRSELRTYDYDLSLSQIIPMADEETDEELKVVAVSFCNPYMLVIRDDSSIQVLKLDRSGDVEPLDDTESSKANKWLSGCLYAGSMTSGEVCAFLLGEEGALHVLRLPDLASCYHAPTLPFLPPVLSPDTPLRRGGRETLTELLVTDLGTEDVKQPYIIVRSSMDDLTLYEPFNYAAETGSSENAGFSTLRFRKVPCPYIPKYDESIDNEDGRPAPLVSAKIGRRRVVYIPGRAPSFIVREATSLSKVLGIRASGVRAFSALNRSGCESGFAVINDEGLAELMLPPVSTFETGWSSHGVALGEPPQEVRFMAYHEDRGVYVVATCRDVDFYLTDSDGNVEHEGITLRPQIPQFTLHVLSAKSHEIIQSLEMPSSEIVTSLKVMTLEISEHTHEQKTMVVVGSAAQRGEDMPAKGAITVFDIMDVVPDPERPESGIKLHVVSREETKGAITALEAFSGGLIGTAQGQKIMIRGLKEDGSCLPVAFLDAQCYIAQLKTFLRSGMWLAGDAWKGLWFGGFTEEPYRLTPMGRTQSQMEVMAAEFLPFDGQLFIMIVDAEMDLHVLQYDPENPKSMSGQRLLHRSTFHLGHFPSSMTLLPSKLAPFAEQPLVNGHADEEDAPPSPSDPESLHHILTTFQSGAIGLITPVDESTYRRLSALQTHLTSILEHAAGLNPRAYRAVESEGFGARGVVDGSLVQRISELGAARKAEVLGRAGADAWGLRSDLEIIGGAGLSYL
ncbi:hypothetical protein LTR36_003134 [Oleoguttula mirabilis]|uniref:Uncharacterized protein n=1 Tax=Oleoguttula mirabilis TaxID=1507867 RepID=A0AAV9JX82_9PEZI|nr:hypothetical protein LTR36_003134 [Oleoguttula mirabilis]